MFTGDVVRGRHEETEAVTHFELDDELTEARRVLLLEAQGVTALAHTLDAAFSSVVTLFAKTSGRIVVTGMGKSGLIARKISATLTSTGTPALFVHPTDASHGDLGMILKDDVVLILSNSGETVELNNIIAYAKRFGISIVGITGVATSTLAGASDYLLLLPKIEEACPLQLAPTTSTTMMLALGDAIAMALLHRKNFSQEDFHLLHPGGKLGVKLIKVCDIMHGPDRLPLVSSDALMSDAILAMSAKSFGIVGIVNIERHLVGIITDGDLRRHMSPHLLRQPVTDIMTRSPKIVAPSAFAGTAKQMMRGWGISCLFVLEGDHICGILHMSDCLSAGVA